MPQEHDNDDDRDRYPQQPQQNSTAHAQFSLFFAIVQWQGLAMVPREAAIQTGAGKRGL
jgi:hypothetical protein